MSIEGENLPENELRDRVEQEGPVGKAVPQGQFDFWTIHADHIRQDAEGRRKPGEIDPVAYDMADARAIQERTGEHGGALAAVDVDGA